MSGFLIGPCGVAPAAVAGGAPAYAFLASPAWRTSGLTSETFSGQPLGTVGANNYTVVGIQMTNGAGSPFTVTIGGVTATVYNPGAGGTAVAWALTPSSTGSIVISNGAAAMNSLSIQVSQVTNVAQVGTPTDTTAFAAQTGTWNVGSGVLVPTNGIAYVSAFIGTNAGTAIPVGGMVLDFLTPIVDGLTASESFSAHTTTFGTLTPTITFSGNGAAAIVVFGP